jgi:Mn2+/Fe2+ NRAMP family transporter
MGRFWTRLRVLGPGLIFSGGAIGTSHLVQSTRAGAMFGAALIGVILLANLLKYPAYRFGIDYSHSRGHSLLKGYRELGLWAPLLFLAVIAPLVPIIIAALGAATAGIVTTIVGPILPIPALAGLILLVATALLVAGGYRWLDRINSVLLAFLTISTLITTAMVAPRVEWGTLADVSWAGEAAALLFIVALVGFMPMPMDVAVPLSLWKVEADRETPPAERPSLGEARSAFAMPYMMTTLLAVCFCVMGAGVMHSEGIAPLTDAPGFAGQIVGLYRSALGDAAAALAAIAALSVMLTTVIVGIDAYTRTFASAVAVFRGREDDSGSRRDFALFALLFVALAILALFTLLSDFAVFLDFVTSASFIIAPVIALLNHLVVTRCEMPEDARPSSALRVWNWLAIVVMAALAAMYFALTLG